uniref:Ribonuclease P/MRP 30 subunit n=1 Tax=Oncorhynchus kisutch TaxID=8019 RepID=A0A8C7D5P8_ONCKI
MAVFMDSNISYTTDKKRLQNVIATAAHLGYSTVAINYVVNLQQKKQEIGQPKCVSELYDTFPIVQGKSRTIKVLNRLTVVASDPSHFEPIAEYKAYDLVAVYPKTEKLFRDNLLLILVFYLFQWVACMTFDVDILCVAVTEKQPFSNSTLRRYTIANSISLLEMCKGKVNKYTHRGSLGLLFGLSEGDGKSAISTNCRVVHLHGETRKTALGIVHTMKKEQPLRDSLRGLRLRLHSRK